MLLLLAFVAMASAVCSDVTNAVIDPGTVIFGSEDCSTAKPVVFGFSADSSSEFLLNLGTPTQIQVQLSHDTNTGSLGSIIPPNGVGSSVSLFNHPFTRPCTCATGDECVAAEPVNSCAVGEYVIPTADGAYCVQFSAELQPASTANFNTMAVLDPTQLAVKITGPSSFSQELTYADGSYATTANGELTALLLITSSSSPDGVFFLACGPLIIRQQTAFKKRAVPVEVSTTGLGTLRTTSTVMGDPHLAGAHKIAFDVYGKPAANYTLVVAPSFQVNMQLADRGPDMRFMKKLTVLYRGTSFTIVPWTVKTQRDALVAHFEALGAKVTFDLANLRITIEICAGHTIEFVSGHTDIPFAISYLDFALTAPSCHNAYGGLLGQTYQCKYATEKFEWSRDREEAFRVPTLDTPHGPYSATAVCANEDEYRGDMIRGSSIGGGDNASTMTMMSATHRNP